jgi:acetyltransferase-like isoleucine patch superfamily enzyme
VRAVRPSLRRLRAGAIDRTWRFAERHGKITAAHPRSRRFGEFGEGAVICFPVTALYGERWMHVGPGAVIGPFVSLAVGLDPEQAQANDPTIVIGEGCSIGAHNGIVALAGVTIGAHVYTGPRVYITDVNHGYERLDEPIGHQLQASRPVIVGTNSWIGTNSVVLPGTVLGEHVVVAAGTVVSGQVPPRCIVAGAPARIIRRFDGEAWVAVDEAIPRAHHERGSVDLV